MLPTTSQMIFFLLIRKGVSFWDVCFATIVSEKLYVKIKIQWLFIHPLIGMQVLV